MTLLSFTFWSGLFQALKNVKDIYSHEESTGAYRISIENVDKGTTEVYIGTMRKSLKDRIDEHKGDISHGNLTTALSRRAYEHYIKIKRREARIIDDVTDPTELNTAEKLHI